MKKEILAMSPELLNQIHRCGQEILDEFVKICDENKLRYYIIAGTLLGAVRHQGPIPWDDDVDVCMPREDYEKFRAIMLARPQGEQFHIACEETDENWPIFILRLMKRGTLYVNQNAIDREAQDKELALDIFPLDNAPNKRGLWYKLHGRTIDFLKNCVRHKVFIITDNFGPKGKILYFLLKPFPIIALRKWTNRLIQKWRGQESDYYVSWGSHYSFLKQTMPKAWYEPSKSVLYSGRYYVAPGEWDKVLTQLYGDYMTPLPEDQRKTHGAIEVKF